MLQIRWEICIKRDAEKVDEDNKCREQAPSRVKWRRILAGMVQQYMKYFTPSVEQQ